MNLTKIQEAERLIDLCKKFRTINARVFDNQTADLFVALNPKASQQISKMFAIVDEIMNELSHQEDLRKNANENQKEGV